MNVYSAVPTPKRINTIVKMRPLVDNGSISPKPTVEIVVTVW